MHRGEMQAFGAENVGHALFIGRADDLLFDFQFGRDRLVQQAEHDERRSTCNKSSKRNRNKHKSSFLRMDGGWSETSERWGGRRNGQQRLRQRAPPET